MKHKKSILEGNIIYTLFAILIGFLTGAIILAIAGMNPGVIYAKLFTGIFAKPKFLAWSVVYATPLIFTGLSVAFSFRTGVFNIGAEGQFVVGSLAATVIGMFCPLPAIITVPLCLIAAAAAGAVWSAFCGLLKVKKGINEVLSFIMMNWIAYYLSNYIVNLPGIKAPSKEATIDILDNAKMLLPLSVRQMTGCTTINYGIIIAIVVAVIIWYIINKTTLGYELRSVGFNSHAAEYGGINSSASRYEGTCYLWCTSRSWRCGTDSWKCNAYRTVCRTGRLWFPGNYSCVNRKLQPDRLYLCWTFLRCNEVRWF